MIDNSTSPVYGSQMQIEIQASLVQSQPASPNSGSDTDTVIQPLLHYGVIENADGASVGLQTGDGVVLQHDGVASQVAMKDGACVRTRMKPSSSDEVLELLTAVLSATAIQNVRRSRFRFGDGVLVAGAECLSLLLLYWCKRQGAFPLTFASSGSDELFETATALGADRIVDVGSNGTGMRLKGAVPMGSQMTAFVGSTMLAQLAAIEPLMIPQGEVFVAARPGKTCELNLYPHVHQRELNLYGGARLRPGPSGRPDLVEISRGEMRSGRLPINRLSGGSFDASQASTALANTPPWKVLLINDPGNFDSPYAEN